MKRFASDLHIHTALSPCALDEMTPGAIVRTALNQGLDMIAVCDHNATHNAEAVIDAAARISGMQALSVLAGIEITSFEEAHIVGLFPDAATAEGVGEVVRQTLPLEQGHKGIVGKSLRMDAHNDVLGRESRMLYMASCLTLEEAVMLIHRNNGLAIPAHVDRPSFSITSQLGTIPEGISFDALEISAAGCKHGRDAAFISFGYPIVTASDSHSLEEIGAARTWLRLKAPTFVELALALRGKQGRCVDGLGGEEGGFRG